MCVRAGVRNFTWRMQFNTLFLHISVLRHCQAEEKQSIMCNAPLIGGASDLMHIQGKRCIPLRPTNRLMQKRVSNPPKQCMVLTYLLHI